MKTSLCALSLVLASQVLSPTAFAQKEPTRDQIDQQLVEMNEVINAAREVPEMRDGQRVGYRLMGAEANNKNYEMIGVVDAVDIQPVNIQARDIQTVKGAAVTNEAISQ